MKSIEEVAIDLLKRFERCALVYGSGEEFVAASTEDHRRILAEAGVELPPFPSGELELRN